MAKIEIKNLSVIFGKEKGKALKALEAGKSKQEILKTTQCTVAVKNASLSVREGEFFVVMGLSGSGKSTLLRSINRLNTPTNGAVLINGQDVLQADEKELRELRRTKMAMVFQHFGLLPHRNVLENIGFGLELQGVEKEERNQKAMESMKLVGLEGYENQLVSALSGGMQQRVGLARAFATDPGVLLMDEAFSALDPLIRNQMQDELISLQKKLKRTIIFITHDLDEAIKLGDRIAIMRDGEIVQVGTSEEILTNPANEYVADFVDSVDRRHIVTASTIMIKNPILARYPNDGPAVVARKMRKNNLTSLPVVDKREKFMGAVSYQEMVRLREQDEKFIDTAIETDTFGVPADTTLTDLLPLMTKTNTPICVVDQNDKILGIIPLDRLVIEMTGKKKKEIEGIIKKSLTV